MGEEGPAPFLLAALAGNEAALRELLTAGADVQQRDHNGISALHYAAYAGSGDAVSLLVAAGADVEARTDTGLTVLQAATLNNSGAIASLAAAGADLDAVGARGMTALHCAVANGDLAAIAALVEAGANLEVLDDTGTSALSCAAMVGSAAAVKALVGAGASLESQDPAGNTPLLSSVLAGHFHLVRLLKDLGADVLAGGPDGCTILHAFALRVAAYPTPNAPQVLCELLSVLGERAAQVWESSPTPLDDLLLRRQVPAVREPRSYFPELIRVFAAAGCPVDTAASPTRRATLVEWFRRLMHEEASWPRHFTANELSVAGTLLECFTAASMHRRAALQAVCLIAAIGLGSLPLLQLLLRVFPDAARQAQGTLDKLAYALRLTLPEEPETEWTAESVRALLHWCDLVAALLEAGTPPAELVLEVSPEFEVIEGASLTVKLPGWAIETLSFLPLVVAGVGWSEERHAAFPPAFRDAARALLLACHRLAAWKRPLVLSLPSGVVAHILQLAAFPLPLWVPQLRPFVHSNGG